MIPTAPPLILHVLHGLHIGGMENGLINLINHLPAAQFRHAIVCIEDFSPEFAARLSRPEVRIIALHRSRCGIWALRRALYRICRELRPALVHTRNLSGLDALWPARLAGVPCLHSEHGWDVDNLEGEACKPRWLRRLHRPLVSHYLAVSEDIARYLRQRIGVPAARLTCVHNGVDTLRFHPAAADIARRDCLPAALRDPAACIIGTVGRLQAVKDQATLLHAFAALVARTPRPACALVIAGEGPLDDALRSLAATLGIADRVVLTGPVAHVPELLRSFDVFALPSLNEGISNTLLEAMASGLPVAATRVGGNVELMVEGETGTGFAPGDVQALAAALAHYVADPVLRARHGQAARARILAEFSLEKMLGRYAALYAALLARP